jgi:hypothetical protein
MIDKLTIKDVFCLFFWYFNVIVAVIGYYLWTIRRDINIILKANSLIAKALTPKDKNG